MHIIRFEPYSRAAKLAVFMIVAHDGQSSWPIVPMALSD